MGHIISPRYCNEHKHQLMNKTTLLLPHLELKVWGTKQNFTYCKCVMKKSGGCWHKIAREKDFPESGKE